MSEKIVSEQNTLEDIFNKSDTFGIDVYFEDIEGIVKEWLEQRIAKLLPNLTWNNGWSYDQKTIKKLLEELK